MNLCATQVTDSGLEHLKNLIELQSLDISYTDVTDVGAENLMGLNQLNELNLYHTQVTDEGVAKLQRALPKCKINRSFD